MTKLEKRWEKYVQFFTYINSRMSDDWVLIDEEGKEHFYYFKILQDTHDIFTGSGGHLIDSGNVSTTKFKDMIDLLEVKAWKLKGSGETLSVWKSFKCHKRYHNA